MNECKIITIVRVKESNRLIGQDLHARRSASTHLNAILSFGYYSQLSETTLRNYQLYQIEMIPLVTFYHNRSVISLHFIPSNDTLPLETF